MAAAVLYGKEELRIESVEVPKISAGDVLVRVRAALTCGTDVKVFRRGYHAKMIVPPALFGHELAGDVVAVGERVKGFEEDDSVARVTDIISPTDQKPLRETLRGYKSQDGEFMIYKVIGGRKMEETEVRELVEKGVVGPLDGFISARTRSRFAATLKLVKDEEKGKWKAEYDFGDKQDLGTLEPFWKDPATGAELCESGNSYLLRERDGEAWKQDRKNTV